MDIGKFNALTVLQKQAAGVYLDGGSFGKLFLSAHVVPDDIAVGDVVDVFVYRAGDDELVATTQKPLAQVGDIAWLKVVSVNAGGTFLDWGLPKDLLVPLSEQSHELELGHFYLVKVLFDPEKGIAATTFIDDYVNYEAFYLKEGQAVSLLIADTTDLGVKAIVNNTYWGLLYKNEIFQTLKKGQKIEGYIKHIREDDRRIDLSLYPVGYAKVEGITDKILTKLKRADNFLPLSDKSSPDVIYAHFGVSKKVFKQAIGALYKQRLIIIEEQGIRLVVAD
ncbi:MAG: S1-like domain-containing RNA-binding protein [Methylococcales bacterium]|nr:S1-like domain-containing RNA-binding protein [Methylococcales bacterium]